ncbi:MAG: DUF362 domain-containing protein [Oscillospiraceae bacterium]
MSDVITIKNISGYDDSAALDSSICEIFANSPLSRGIASDARVVLKLNTLMKASPDEAVTTHPAVVGAAINALHKLGARDITLCDSPSGPFSRGRLKGIYDVCGLTPLARDGVRLALESSSVTVSCDGTIREFEILRTVKNADIVIGICKLKTHALMGMTGAVKNYFGAIPGLGKAQMHCRFPDSTLFADMLCELCDTIAPDFSLVDAVVGMQGNGPSGGEPRTFGFVAGSADPFALDLMLSHILGISPCKALTVASSIASGRVSETALSLNIMGDRSRFDEPIQNLELPDSFKDSVPPQAQRPLPRALQNFIAPHPVVRWRDCIGCGRCAEICPLHAISLLNRRAKIDSSRCIRCFCCHEVCPQRAIDIKKSVLFKVFK